MSGNGLELGIDGLTDFHPVGTGGFATVYSAREEQTDRRVAVKVLTDVAESSRRRFDRELKSMGRASDHNNVVTLFRWGYTTSAKQPYVVMEYLSGGSLQDRVDNQGPIPWPEAIDLLLPIAEALRYTDSLGIVHRDVKPANILVSGSGTVKLADFGIAAAIDTNATGQVSFSRQFTSPETFSARADPESGLVIDPRDGRSDLYSLAVTLFAIGTGRPPFVGPTDGSLIHQILNDPLSSTGHQAVDSFLSVAAAKGPSNRYQDAASFINALRDLKDQVAGNPTAPSAPVGTPVSSADPDQTAPIPQPQTQVNPPGMPHPVSAPAAPPVPPIQPSPAAQPTVVEQIPVASPIQLPLPAPIPPATPRHSVPPGSIPTTPRPRPPHQPTATKRGRRIAGLIVVLLLLTGGGLLARTLIVDADDTDDTAGGSVDAGDGSAEETPGDSQTEPAEPIFFNDHEGSVEAIVQLPDGRLASAGSSGVIRLWLPTEDPETDTTYEGHSGQVEHLLVLENGNVASASADGTVQVWDPTDPAVTLSTYAGHDSDVQSLAELPDGLIASASIDKTVHIWDPEDPSDTLAKYENHEGNVWDVIALPGGLIASASSDKTVHIWDPKDPTVTLATFRRHDQWVESLVLLQSGEIASSSGDLTVKIWDPSRPSNTLATYVDHDQFVDDLVELSDGTIASASRDGTVNLWHPDRRRQTLATFQTSELGLESVAELSNAVDESERRLALAGNDGTVTIWDPGPR